NRVRSDRANAIVFIFIVQRSVELTLSFTDFLLCLPMSCSSWWRTSTRTVYPQSCKRDIDIVEIELVQRHACSASCHYIVSNPMTRIRSQIVVCFIAVVRQSKCMSNFMNRCACNSLGNRTDVH